MTIPTQSEMYRKTLGFMLDGEIRTLKQIKAKALEALDMLPSEVNEKTSSGTQVWDSRVGWSVSFLQRAELFKRISRGVYVITDEGKQVYALGIDGHEMQQHLDKLIAERNPWNTGGLQKKAPAVSTDVNTEKSPVEQIDDLMSEINDNLGNELLSLILDQDPGFFEKLVVDLLEAMGYGRGEVTKYTNDGGIDGMISTDELGFRPIYTQAKRYKLDSKVGRPEIQAFMGALGAVPNGVFITTAYFTKEAREAAKMYPHATIVLIDGEELVRLMIKYDLGVTTERRILVKRVDSDYFEN